MIRQLAPSFGMRFLFLFCLMTSVVLGGFCFPQASGQSNEKKPRRSSYVPTANELHESLAPGTVKFEVKKYGVPLATGSGFFVSKDGAVAVDRNLASKLIMDSDATAEISTSDKKTFKDPQILSCDLLDGSICVLKIAFQPKKLIAPIIDPVPEGADASSIGHPQGMDFSIARGDLTGIKRKTKNRIDSYEITGNFGTAFAGGPVFTNDEHLLGALKGPIPGAEKIYGVSSLTSLDLVTLSEQKPLSLSEARNRFPRLARSRLAEFHLSEKISTAIRQLGKGQTLPTPQGTKLASFTFDRRELNLELPELFDDCTFSIKTKVSTLYSCFAFDRQAIFTIQKVEADDYKNILAKNGQTLLNTQPLEAIKELMKSGDWEDWTKKLKPHQLAKFSSNPSLAKCQKHAPTAIGWSPLFKGAPVCRFNVENDVEMGASSNNVWIYLAPHLYMLTIWTSHPILQEQLADVAWLATLSARWDSGSNPASPAASLTKFVQTAANPIFTIQLPKNLSFMGTLKSPEGIKSDLYGKPNLLNQFEEGYVAAVTGQSRVFLPPDFNKVTIETLKAIVSSLEYSFINGSSKDAFETDADLIDGRPVRIATTHVRDKARVVHLAMTGTIFYEDQTFEITLILKEKDGAKNLADTLAEFKSLLKSFKRN